MLCLSKGVPRDGWGFGRRPGLFRPRKRFGLGFRIPESNQFEAMVSLPDGLCRRAFVWGFVMTRFES